MENYAYNSSYPDSGESSPRSREIDFENPTPWEDQSQPYKAKFMCSYGGKIHPRPHDNQLSYIGGETKILAVDRNIKFSNMVSKLSSLCGEPDVAFKYQLPGEDLDALISVTNDDDLEHMMHEYDRLYRASAKPARMRLFLFPVLPSPAGSFSSDSGRVQFVEALNANPSQDKIKPPPQNNVDLLFGIEKGVPKVPELPEFHVPVPPEDRVSGFTQEQLNLQTHLQMLQIRDQQLQQQHQPVYRKPTNENFSPAAFGDYYVQKLPEKPVPPQNIPPQVSAPPGYWPEKQVSGGFHAPSTVTTAPAEQPPVYMIPATHGPVYHHNVNPVVRPVTGQAGQGYYVQRMGGPGSGPEVYRDQQVYNMIQPPAQQQGAVNTMGMARPSVGPGMDTGYGQVAYDSGGGRQVFYTAAGGVVQQAAAVTSGPQYQGVVGMSGEMRGVVGGPIIGGQEGKVVTSKISPTSM